MRLRLAFSAAVIVSMALVGVLAGAAAPAVAATDDFEIASFDAEYFLGRTADGDATLRTVEQIVAVFPDFDQNRGIERALPRDYGNVSLSLSVVGVTDAAGNTVNYSLREDGDFTVLRIGDRNRYVHGQQTYRIEYVQKNVIRPFGDTGADEFYWDVNGTGWAQPFGEVSATVHLGDGLASELTGGLACYQGGYGGSKECSIDRAGDTITASARALGGYENMTIAVGFSPDAFTDPPDPRYHWAFTLLPWVLLGFSLLVVLALIYSRVFLWRDHPGRGIIVPQYTPPKTIYPLLAAELLQRKGVGLPAQIISFAVNRILQLREFPQKPKHERYQVELIAGWPTVSDQEKPALKALFGKLVLGDTEVLKDTNYSLGKRLAKLRKATTSAVVADGLRIAPKNRWQITLAALVWVAWLVAGMVWFISTQYSDAGLLLATPLVCLLAAIVSSRLAKAPLLLTEKGAEVRDYLYGIRDYVKLAEADRFRMLQAPGTAERIDVTDESAIVRLYEKLLPYAMIFGVERDWIAELKRHYELTDEPNWYQGTGQISDVAVFGATVSSTRFATAAAVASASSGSSWTSSGGSSFSGGSSGGGFSGGGGGGGGGGGW